LGGGGGGGGGGWGGTRKKNEKKETSFYFLQWVRRRGRKKPFFPLGGKGKKFFQKGEKTDCASSEEVKKKNPIHHPLGQGKKRNVVLPFTSEQKGNHEQYLAMWWGEEKREDFFLKPAPCKTKGKRGDRLLPLGELEKKEGRPR